jgi:putative FmdB family regulatory protein
MTYEYVCTQCGYEWIIEAKITDKSETICPNCKEKTAKRLISGGLGFQLKGNGWASEGYK